MKKQDLHNVILSNRLTWLCSSFQIFHPATRLCSPGLPLPFLEGFWLQVAVTSSFVTTYQARRHGVFKGGHGKSLKNRRNQWKPERWLKIQLRS